MFGALGGGDVAAPTNVRGLLLKYNSHLACVAVRVREEFVSGYVLLYTDGTAEYRSQNGNLFSINPFNQRARDILASATTLWEMDRNGLVRTKQIHAVEDHGGAE